MFVGVRDMFITSLKRNFELDFTCIIERQIIQFVPCIVEIQFCNFSVECEGMVLPFRKARTSNIG